MTTRIGRRLLALVLALVLALPMFAFAEEAEDVISAPAEDVVSAPAEEALAEQESIEIGGEAEAAEVPEAVAPVADEAEPADEDALDEAEDEDDEVIGAEANYAWAPDSDRTVYIYGNATITCNLGDTVDVIWSGDDNFVDYAKSSSKKIVSVQEIDYDNIWLDMNKVGKTKIKIKLYKGKKYTLTVKVVDPYAPTGVWLFGKEYTDLHKKTLTYPVGFQVSLNGMPLGQERESEKAWQMTWKTSRKSVASVDSDGQVTCNKAGKAKITVSTYNGKKQYCYIKVVKNKQDKINPKPSKKAIKAGYLSENDAYAILKSVEIKGRNTIAVEYYIVNGTSKKRNIYIEELTLDDISMGSEIAATREDITVKRVPAYGCKVLKVTYHSFEWARDYQMNKYRYNFGWYDECTTERPGYY